MDWTSVILGAFLGVAGMFGLISLALYPVMRREFLLWSFGRTLGFFTIALMTVPNIDFGGMLSAQNRIDIGELGVAIAVACSGPFLAAYIEDRLGLARLKQWLRITFWAGITAGAATFIPDSDHQADLIHDVLMLSVIVAIIAGLVIGIRAGSRAARFQVLAWGPLILIGVAELIHELMTGTENPYWPLAVLGAVALDFIVTARGLADGFMIIQSERDLAIEGMESARRALGTDALTGIANRRGLEIHFRDAANRRPRGVAILDCDHFKPINDRYGHDVGDEVLVEVARALEGRDVFAARLGGEEFVLLLYGDDWRSAGEAARRRITDAVAEHVLAMPEPVTASAGIAELRGDDNLRSCMKRADRALYVAKNAGRDRSVDADEVDLVEGRLVRAA